MRSHWSRVGPFPNITGLLIRQKRDTQGKGYVAREAETRDCGYKLRDSKQCQQIPGAEKRQGEMLPKGVRDSMALPTP